MPMPEQSVQLWKIVMRKDHAAFAKYCSRRTYNEVRAAAKQQFVDSELVEEMIQVNRDRREN